MTQRGVEGTADVYDVVVIGAGLGGMTCANRLARQGRSVLLLEQHIQLGGLATWFRRKGHLFDVALHGFPVGMIKTVRKYWSKEVADRITQLRGIRFDNPQFQLTTDYTRDDFTRQLVEVFGIAPSAVQAFFDHTRSMNFYDDDGRSTRELFEEFFPGRDDVIRLLMEPITYANGSTLDDPAISYGIVFSNFMSKGVFTFHGGTDEFIGLLENELNGSGVDVRIKARAEKILTDSEGRTTGVIVNGKTIGARSVVSNGNLKSTILDLLDSPTLPDEFRQEAEQVRINTSSCQVYIGLKEEEKIDYMGDLIFTSTADKFDTDLMLGKKRSAPAPTRSTTPRIGRRSGGPPSSLLPTLATKIGPVWAKRNIKPTKRPSPKRPSTICRAISPASGRCTIIWKSRPLTHSNGTRCIVAGRRSAPSSKGYR